MQQQVIAARAVAGERYSKYGWGCNAEVPGSWMRANTSVKALEIANRAPLASHRLSLRGVDRAMRLAWTLADLAGKTSPGPDEMSQGIMLRARMS